MATPSQAIVQMGGWYNQMVIFKCLESRLKWKIVAQAVVAGAHQLKVLLTNKSVICFPFFYSGE